MSKIVCDICGTTYQDTSEQCPICGCTRDAAAALLNDAVIAEEVVEEAVGKGRRNAGKRKEIFDFDEVNDPSASEEDNTQGDDYDDEEEYDDERPRHNTFVVILLTILIVALLAVAGFLFVRYFLPNMAGDQETTAATQEIETTAMATTELTIPCQTLVMTSGTAELNEAGQYFLVHVIAMPEDTTDEIKFASGDESIATVTEDGRITAVAEGETVIYITCGNQQLMCPVVCEFIEETTAPATEETQTGEATGETAGEETDETTGDATEETTDGQTDETTEATEAVDKSGVTLKLKKNDITLGVYLQFTLVLDCDLEPTDVEWSSEHPHIATVDENGVVTAKKYGTTIVTAKYGSQEVQCWIRCVNS